MNPPRVLARIVSPKSLWEPLDPETKEEISKPEASASARNYLDDEVLEGPPVGPGEIFFLEDFTLKLIDSQGQDNHGVNIFLDTPKNSVIILSLGLMADGDISKAMNDGTLSAILSDRLKTAIDAVSAPRPQENTSATTSESAPGL
jgi:hypothetical protein